MHFSFLPCKKIILSFLLSFTMYLFYRCNVTCYELFMHKKMTSLRTPSATLRFRLASTPSTCDVFAIRRVKAKSSELMILPWGQSSSTIIAGGCWSIIISYTQLLYTDGCVIKLSITSWGTTVVGHVFLSYRQLLLRHYAHGNKYWHE